VQAPTDPDWRKTLTNVGYSKKSEKGKINKKACVVKSSKWMMEKSAGTPYISKPWFPSDFPVNQSIELVV